MEKHLKWQTPDSWEDYEMPKSSRCQQVPPDVEYELGYENAPGANQSCFRLSLEKTGFNQTLLPRLPLSSLPRLLCSQPAGGFLPPAPVCRGHRWPSTPTQLYSDARDLNSDQNSCSRNGFTCISVGRPWYKPQINLFQRQLLPVFWAPSSHPCFCPAAS